MTAVNSERKAVEQALPAVRCSATAGLVRTTDLPCDGGAGAAITAIAVLCPRLIPQLPSRLTLPANFTPAPALFCHKTSHSILGTAAGPYQNRCSTEEIWYSYTVGLYSGPVAPALHVAGSIPVSNALIEWGIIVNNIRRPPPRHTPLAGC